MEWPCSRVSGVRNSSLSTSWMSARNGGTESKTFGGAAMRTVKSIAAKSASTPSATLPQRQQRSRTEHGLRSGLAEVDELLASAGLSLAKFKFTLRVEVVVDRQCRGNDGGLVSILRLPLSVSVPLAPRSPSPARYPSPPPPPAARYQGRRSRARIE